LKKGIRAGKVQNHFCISPALFTKGQNEVWGIIQKKKIKKEKEVKPCTTHPQSEVLNNSGLVKDHKGDPGMHREFTLRHPRISL